jgi:hypothetical protein
MSSDSKFLALQKEVFVSSLYRLVKNIDTITETNIDFAQCFKTIVVIF